jgi:ABC-2 type transport system ATP-binding protein
MGAKEVAIEVKNLSKSFKLPAERSSELKQSVVNFFQGIKGYKEQKVLREISFVVNRGDFFGIVGRNGSGKSTLLKIISGIYEPNGGSIKIDGSLVPFIELGVGFSPELTGRENVYLNGALLGFSEKEVEAMYGEIVDFAELQDFMGQKLKNYSSGMQVRLAFSIAIRAKTDILVLDEVLAVGDEAFQRKCYGYFAELKRENKTVVLVTHSMESIQRFCNRAMMIDEGEIKVVGDPARVALAYREINNRPGTGGGRVGFDNDNFDIKTKVKIEAKNIFFDFIIRSKNKLAEAVIILAMIRDNGEVVYRWVSDEKMPKRKLDLHEGIKLHLEVENILPVGVFDMQIRIKKRDRSVEYAIVDKAIVFEVVNSGQHAADILWKPKEKYELIEGL